MSSQATKSSEELVREPELVGALNRGVRSKSRLWRLEGAWPFLAEAEVRRYRLGNGLSVLLRSEREASSLSYHTWVGVGSRHERPGKTGLAHLFEHLMFGGTPTRPLGEFDRIIESLGGESNAATWTDWTTYYINLPSGALPLAVDVEADRFANLRLEAAALASEKEVVVNERRYRVDDDVGGAAEELLYLTALGNTPYGRPTIGFMEDIASLTLGDCRAFFKQHYVPQETLLVLTGSFDDAEALSLIRDKYGALKVRSSAPPVSMPRPRQQKERRKSLRWPTPASKIHIAYHSPAFGDDDYLALELLTEALFGSTSSRFVRSMVLDDELATDVSGGLTPFEYPGLLELSVALRQGIEAKKGLEKLDTLINGVLVQGLTEKEVDAAKTRLELGYWQSLDTPYGKAEQLGFYAQVLGNPVAGPGRLDKQLRLTPYKLKQVARKYLQASRRTVLFVEPQDLRTGGLS